jgi:hypothetical protein
MLSNEQKILTLAANINPDEGHLQSIRGGMSTILDTNHLIDLAVKEGMAGFLYKNLLKAGLLETIDPRHKQKLYNSYYLTIRHNLKLIHALNEILSSISQREIQVVLMQGISLLQQVYRDIGLRPMNDMDLWVLPQNYECLVDCLCEQGYVRNSLYPDTFSKGEIMLDVHTHILWADRIRNRDLLLNKCQEEIFNKARIINFEQTSVLCLSSADQFLYLSLHALKHNLERLIWLVDIKSLVAFWDLSAWQALIKRAEELGHVSTMNYMLFVLNNIFNLKLPPKIAALLDEWQLNFFERKVLGLRVRGRSIPTWTQLILISAGKGLRQRLSFVRETLFPRPKILRQVFANSPQLSVRQLYWKRLLQIFGAISK